MRKLEHLGPALVTLAAAGALLLAAPAAVRQLTRESTAIEMASADLRLQKGTILDGLSQSMRDIATLVEPSVVHVSTVGSMRGSRNNRPVFSSGSGWVYDEHGHIVTNAHVVDGSNRVEVQLNDGERREAKLIGLDLKTDIAVLQTSASGLVAARRALQDPQQGELVFAFGSPFDFRFSMSSGIVSGIGRTAGLQEIDYENFIQTDAAVNPGNSGGPLTDTRGSVVGMTTAIATGKGNAIGQGQFAGIGLAIPISMIDNVVDQLIARGEVEMGFLGVVGIDLDRSRRRMMEPNPLIQHVLENYQGEGVLLSVVTPDSPAANAGMQVADVLVQLGGQRVASSAQMSTLVAGHRPGEVVAAEVWRPQPNQPGGGSPVLLQVTMGRLDPETNARSIPQAIRALGLLKLATSTQAAATAMGIPFHRGVLVQQVLERSPAAEKIPVGSVIVETFGAQVNNLDDFYTRILRRLPMNGKAIDAPMTLVRPDGTVVNATMPLRMLQTMQE